MSLANMSGSRQVVTASQVITTQTITTETLIKQLSDRIVETLSAFQTHSDVCKRCRNPVRVYTNGQQLCAPGHELATRATELLYRKAALVPKGSFRVEYEKSWEAVDGLIRMISHANQGEMTHRIIDLNRAVPRAELEKEKPKTHPRGVEYIPPPSRPRSDSAPSKVGRGSAFAEDMKRVQPADRKQPAERRRHEDHHHAHGRPHSPNRRTSVSLHHRPADLDLYGTPHTSYLNVPHAQGQSSPVPPGSPSSSSSNRSVSFNPIPEVRKYDPNER